MIIMMKKKTEIVGEWCRLRDTSTDALLDVEFSHYHRDHDLKLLKKETKSLT